MHCSYAAIISTFHLGYGSDNSSEVLRMDQVIAGSLYREGNIQNLAALSLQSM